MDYWDKLGWRDPFGSKQMTEAQKAYAKPLALTGMYTPMLVVGGAMHTPSLKAAAKKIEEDGKSAAVAGIAVSGKRSAAGAVVEAKIAVTQDERQPVEVTIAVAENDLKTDIEAGELKGHKVTEFGVVRYLSKPATPGEDGKVAFEIPSGKDWKTENVYLAVVARDPATKKVLGAARMEWKDLLESK